MDFIHHYTKIDTLEAIVRNNCFRFNRLDKVDDEEESKFWSGPTKLKTGKYIFVSSWTREEKEIDDLWRRYGDNYKGVRISIEEPFLEFEEKASFNNFRHFAPDETNYDNCVFPWIYNQAKLHDIIYVPDNEERIKDLIHDELDLVEIKMNELGIYKNTNPWECQQESRYRMNS